MKMYIFESEEEQRVAAAGIGVITARIYAMGQFTVNINQSTHMKEKNKLVENAVDKYMDELMRIGFSIQIDEEEED